MAKPKKVQTKVTRQSTTAKRQPNVSRHKSFRPTKRRDAVRPLELPGYWAFTTEVARFLWTNKKIFIGLILLYALLIVFFGGISNQDIYGNLNLLLGSEATTVFDTVAQAGLAALLGLSGAGAAISDVQQVYLGLAVILVWLSTVWLLREIFAGRTPKVRDGLYNSGSPIISTTLLIAVGLIQLLPLSLLMIAYNGLQQAELITEGLGAMLFFIIAALTATLSMYWITATFIALVIVTLPGMYPFQALRTASSIVAGRRLKIMFRIIWMAALLLVTSLIVLIPAVLFNEWLRSLADWLTILPLLPASYAIVSAAVTVAAASYIYLLYRKVVAYDAETSR